MPHVLWIIKYDHLAGSPCAPGQNGAEIPLMKILSGVYQPSDGVIRVNGQVVERLNRKLPGSGHRHHSSELSINEISIAENIF